MKIEEIALPTLRDVTGSETDTEAGPQSVDGTPLRSSYFQHGAHVHRCTLQCYGLPIDRPMRSRNEIAKLVGRF